MADLSDIERGLVTLIAGALFPATGYMPGAFATTSGGQAVKVVRGWPTQDALNSDLAAGRAVISIFAEHGMTRNVSRWPTLAVQVSTVTPTLTVAVAGAAVTLAGTITAGNVVGIAAGSPLAAHAYIIQAADTLASIATALAAKIAGATAAGPVVTLAARLNLVAGVMVPQTVLTITRQQEQGFRISVWTATPAARDILAGQVDNALSAIHSAGGMLTTFFAVTPYESARLMYRTTYVSDMPARDRLWRRDLLFNVEYPTTLIEQDPIMLFGGGTESIGVTGTVHQIGALPPA